MDINAATAMAPRGVSLKPDLVVPMTFADYAEGQDPVLDAALAHFAEDCERAQLPLPRVG